MAFPTVWQRYESLTLVHCQVIKLHVPKGPAEAEMGTNGGKMKSQKRF